MSETGGLDDASTMVPHESLSLNVKRVLIVVKVLVITDAGMRQNMVRKGRWWKCKPLANRRAQSRGFKQKNKHHIHNNKVYVSTTLQFAILW